MLRFYYFYKIPIVGFYKIKNLNIIYTKLKMSGLSIIQDTTTYNNMPMGRKPALDAVDVKVRSAGSIIGHSYLRNAKLQPIDVMYKQALYSNTPRIGVQNPSLPDLRMKRQSGGAQSLLEKGNKSEVGDATPMEGGAMDIKRALKIWDTIHSQMSGDEKKHVEKANKAVSMIKKVVDTLDSDKLNKLKKSKTMKWLMGIAKKQFGAGGECMCGEGFWRDLKKKALKVGKAVSKTAKGVAKRVKPIARTVKGVAKTVGRVAQVGAEIAAVIPGLQEFAPVLESVAGTAKSIEKGAQVVQKVARKTQKYARKGQQATRKELQKMRGKGLPKPSISKSITRSTRGDDRVMFNALHPLNYKKAVL